jgi:hypothetical protein
MTPKAFDRALTATFCLALWLARAPSASADLGKPVLDSKKLIGFAVNVVEPAYLKEHIGDIERLPLDGLVIAVYPDDWGPTRTGQEGMFFGGHAFTLADFAKASADLKATRFTRFTDNFIQVETQARGSAVTGKAEDGNLDWFDPKWPAIAGNGAVVASLAKDAGFKGLYLDVESYAGALGAWGGRSIFDYSACPSKDKHTLTEVAAQIELRGRQFMEAVGKAYPGITIVIIPNTGWGRSDLVESFVKGVLETRGQATLVDGGEEGYSLVARRELALLRKRAQDSHSQDELFKPMQYAFGVWVDPTPDTYGGWHTTPADFDRNYRSPSEFENTLHGALTEADKYVWLFTWHPDLWFTPVAPQRRLQSQCVLCPHDKVPDEYVRALAECRKPHDLDWAPRVAQNRVFYFDDAVLVEGACITGSEPNLLDDSGFEEWTPEPGSLPKDWDVHGEGPIITKEETHVKSGKYAAALTTERFQGHVIIDKRFPAQRFAGKTVTLGVWIQSKIKDVAGVQILDFVQGMHDISSGLDCYGDGQWHFIAATRTVRANAAGDVIMRISASVPFLKEPG